MTPPKYGVPGYIFGSAKAGETARQKAGTSRIRPLPSVDELLGKRKDDMPEPDTVQQFSNMATKMTDLVRQKNIALENIIEVCTSPGRSADKVEKIKAMAEVGRQQ